MKKNLGSYDRIFRVALAGLLVILYVTGVLTGPLSIALIIFPVILVITSLVGFCPLYLPFGLSTLRKKLTNNK